MAQLHALDFKQIAWKSCNYCSNKRFKSPDLFIKHLRERHCSVEGGSFVCRYGYNGVCSSLPLDGVNDKDYEAHVEKYHVNQTTKEIEQKWNVFSAAQNLPAVLNDPSRGRQSNLFTKKWGDSFVDKTQVPYTPYLVNIEWKHFELYCKKIGKRYRRHQRLGAVPQHHNPCETPTSYNSLSPSSSISSLHIANSSNFNHSHANSNHNNNNNSRFHDSNLLDESSIKDIPQIFMKQDFYLSQSHTFNVVFSGLDSKNESDHRAVQEKLSHYLDIVEIQIAKQVSQKSSSFFHAMTSQDTIMEEMEKAVTNVRLLRQKLRHIDETLVKQSLNIISSERIKTNKIAVLEKLRLMATVHQTQPMIQVLLGTQDYVAALDLISTTQEILSQELSGIHCFKHLPSQLKEIEKLIDKMLTTDFERYSTADMNRPLLEFDNGVLDEDKLVCIISGLLRKKNFSFIDCYKDEAITTIRALIKQLMIEVLANRDAEICLTGAGEEAQILSLAEWILLLETATDLLMKLLKRIRLIHDVMLHVASSSAGKFPDDVTYFSDSDTFLTETDLDYIENKLKNLLQSVCNYCHERCANLVLNQELEKYDGTLEEIEKLSKVVHQFCEGCEELVGVKSIPLMSALKAQDNRFTQKFHGDRKHNLSLLLDVERWKQTEVPAEFQKMIDYISRDDFLWTKLDGEGAPPSPVLMVEEEPYALVGAALKLVQIISEYCRCASQLPELGLQMSRCLVDLLRTFNSRSCQLVLGAGAVHVAGLKMITISNLALVSRALQLVLWLLPHVKNHFQKYEQTTVSGYQTIERDFASHISELENKMLSIVSPLVNTQLSNWDARPPVPSQSFRKISAHFLKLHEAFAPILPLQQTHTIFRIVHKNFKDKLREQLLKNNIINNGTPQHGIVISELTFYLETLRKLKAMPPEELTDECIDDVWIK